MAETGWPLIPREVLPAPIPAARPAQRLPHVDGPHTDSGRQLSIFGAETTEPSPADLAGLLAGPGHLVRMGGTARISIRVDAGWRVHVLVNELVRRGLVVTWRPVETDQEVEQIKPQETDQPLDGTAHRLPDAGTTSDQHTDPPEAPDYDEEPASAVIGGTHDQAGDHPDGGDGDAPADPGAGAAGVSVAGGVAFFEVRTAYSSRLNGLARSWSAAAHRLFLSGPRLRLWVAAAGLPLDGGFALGLDPREDPAIVDAALVRAGLAGTVSDDGRYYLILGRKRLTRLAELVGERPREAPAALWPSGVRA
jgi:hypothetical protein